MVIGLSFLALSSSVAAAGFLAGDSSGRERAAASSSMLLASGPVTASGNEITDLVRAASVQGDGRAASDSSFGIWQGTTNLLRNGGFETDASDWSGINGATVSRDTTQAKFGSASLKVVAPARGAGALCGGGVVAVSPSTRYTFSAWVYVPASGGNLQLFWDENVGLSYNNTKSGPNYSLVAGWQRISMSATTSASVTSINPHLKAGVGGAVTFWLDGVQVEQAPIARPYVQTNGVTASRAAARVQSSADALDETQGWVAFRLRLGWGNSAEPGSGTGTPTLFDWRDDANHRLTLAYDEASNAWTLRRTAGAGTALSVGRSVNSGDLTTVVATWTAMQLKLSVNGSAFTARTDSSIPVLGATSFDIGSQAGTANFIDGDVLWMATGTGSLTDSNATTLNNFGNTDPTLGQLPGSATLAWTAGIAPANTQQPTITGVPQQDLALTASPGSWTGTLPISYGYQWQRCSSATSCTDITGATAASYTATSGDIGYTLAVAVTASSGSGSASSAASQTTAVTDPWGVAPGYTGPIFQTEAEAAAADPTAPSLPVLTVPSWRNLYDWPNGHGYVGWHDASSAPAGAYSFATNLGGNYGLWLWPTGGKPNQYTADYYAEWKYRAPGTTRLSSAVIDFAYRNKLLAHHCIQIGFRTDTAIVSQQEWCKPVTPPDSQRNVNLTIVDPAGNPTSKELFIRIRVDCQNTDPTPCSKYIPQLDPLQNAGYIRVKKVDMILVDDDNPNVYLSNTFPNLTYINGTQTYPLTVGANDAGSGIVRNWAERVGVGTILTQDAPCDPTHHTEDLDARICPESFSFTGNVDTSPLPEGRNDFVAKSIDVANNVGVSFQWSVLIDRTGPNAPTDFDIWNYDSTAREVQVEWDASVSDPNLPTGEAGSGVGGAQYRYRVNGGSFTAWTDPDAGTDGQAPGFTVPNVSVGDVISVEVREFDNVGNAGQVGSASLTVSAISNNTDLPLDGPAVADSGSSAFSPPKLDWAPDVPPMFADDSPEDSIVSDIDYSSLVSGGSLAAFSPNAALRPAARAAAAKPQELQPAAKPTATSLAATTTDVPTKFSSTNPCGLGSGDTAVGSAITVSSTLHAQRYTRCIVFWNGSSGQRNWTIYTTCVQQQGTSQRRGVGPGYVGVMRDEGAASPLLVNDLRWRRNGSSTFKDIGGDAAFSNVGNIGAANGGLGTFEIQYARGNPPRAWSGRFEWLPDGKLPGSAKLGGFANELKPFPSGVKFPDSKFIGERLCSDQLVPGNPPWGVYEIDSHQPKVIKGTIRYQIEVWLKDPWSQSTSPQGKAVIGVQHLYKFTGSRVQEVVSVKTFDVPAAPTGEGVPLVKEPKTGVTLRGNGLYNQIRYYVIADGSERLVAPVKRGQPEFSPWVDPNDPNQKKHADSLNSVQDAPANRSKVEWGSDNPCNGSCFDVAARAMKPLWVQAGSKLDPFNRARLLWTQQALGLNGWAISSEGRSKAYVRDTTGTDQVTNCSADPALRGIRKNYPPNQDGLNGWLAHLTALSEDANPGLPRVRQWEIAGWKNGLSTGQRSSDLPYTGSEVMFHGWEGAEGPEDCEPLMVSLGAGVYTNFLDFSFR